MTTGSVVGNGRTVALRATELVELLVARMMGRSASLGACAYEVTSLTGFLGIPDSGLCESVHRVYGYTVYDAIDVNSNSPGRP